MRNHSSFRTFLKIALALEPLLVASIAAAQPLTFTPFHETGIYALGETAGWNVSASADIPDPYHYVIKRNNSDIVKSGDLEFTGGHATIEAAVNEPAMLYVEVTSSAAGSRPIHLGAAVAPEKLQLSASSVRFRQLLGRQIESARRDPDQPAPHSRPHEGRWPRVLHRPTG